MIRRRVPQQGDAYWVNPNPVADREMKDRHRFVVITPHEINAPGVAVCNQVRTFNLEARTQAGSAQYIETLDEATTGEIVARVVSVIDPVRD